MNEGCSACACGVPNACDTLYFPEFLWPGVASLVVVLLVLLLLSRKKILKLRVKTLITGWLVLVLIFAGMVYINIESAGDRTRRAAERCQASGDPTCEY